jgi:hypothetical protein
MSTSARHPDLTPDHFDLPAAMQRAVAARVSPEQISGHTYPLLTPRGALRPEDLADCTYARDHGPGFLELLVHQDGERVRRLTDDDVAEVGATDLFASPAIGFATMVVEADG